MNTTKFKNQYRVPSTRLLRWDYAGDGIYFITICTKDRECYLGDIEQGQMKLSPAGKIVQEYWQDIPQHFPFVELDEFVIMPNHAHGIVWIQKHGRYDYDEHGDRRDEAMPRLYNREYNGKYPQMSKISPKPNSLSSIIGSFKSICTKQIRKSHNPHFQWQARFYDHIIRNEEALAQIREYVRGNPMKWDWERI